jgi:hypothetical protein
MQVLGHFHRQLAASFQSDEGQDLFATALGVREPIQRDLPAA